MEKNTDVKRNKGCMGVRNDTILFLLNRQYRKSREEIEGKR